MANEIDTGASAGEHIQAEILSRLIIRAAYAPTVVLPTVRMESLIGQPSNTGDYNKYPLLSAAGLTDGTAVGNSAYNPTSTSVSSAEIGLSLEMTDLFRAGAIIDMSNLAMQEGMALSNKIDTDLAAEFGDFTTTIGSTGTNLLNSDILTAIYNIKNGNLVDRGPIVGILHPIQIFDWLTDLETNVTSTPFGAESMNASAPFSVDRGFRMYGIDWFESTLCASVNTNADRQGAIYPRGQQAPLVFQIKWNPRVEMERDAKMRSWSAVGTAAYGDENIDNAGGFAITSDHE